MKSRADLLAHRRERLVRRSGQLRRRAAHDMQALQPAFTWIDRVQDAWHWLRTNPLVALAGAVALVVWRPRGAVNTGVRAWTAWRWLEGLRAPRRRSG